MKVFLDTNILLDYILKRDRYEIVRDFLLTTSDDICISMLTVHLIHHFCSKHNITPEVIRELISMFIILPMSPLDYDIAFTLTDLTDFEDCLQIACCLSNECDTYITLDKKLYSRYKHLGIIKPL